MELYGVLCKETIRGYGMPKACKWKGQDRTGEISGISGISRISKFEGVSDRPDRRDQWNQLNS